MSWNGLIRKQVKYHHNESLEIPNDDIINAWFGMAIQGTKNSKASKIIIEESIIENAKEIEIVRNKIDRFSGGSADSALFNERAQFNGNTKLTIRIPKTIRVKNKELNNNYILGLLALTLKDIDNGLIALGGQTSIGRGIFKVLDVRINEEKIDLDDLIKNISVKDAKEVVDND